MPLMMKILKEVVEAGAIFAVCDFQGYIHYGVTCLAVQDITGTPECYAHWLRQPAPAESTLLVSTESDQSRIQPLNRYAGLQDYLLSSGEEGTQGTL